MLDILAWVASVLGVLGVGYAISHGQAKTIRDLLERDIAGYKAEIKRLADELQSVRLEYQQYTDEFSKRLTETNAVEGAPTEVIDVVVKEGRTKSLFDGDLFVSLIQSKFGGDPLVHRAYGTVKTAAGETQELKGREPGDVIELPGFEIRLMAVRSYDAELQVKRTNKT